MTSTRAQCAALLALCGLAYLPAFQSFFVKDDIALLLSAGADLPGALNRSWPGGFYRPAAEVLVAWQYHLFGFNPLPYHLVSFVAHLAAVYLTHGLFRRLDIEARASFAAAAVFALHPLNTETVSWISGQMSLFAALCALACLALAARPAWQPALILVGAIGLGLYENFPVVALLWYGIYLARPSYRHLPSRPVLLAAILLGGAYLYWRYFALDLSRGYYEVAANPVTALVNLAYYVYLLAGGNAVGGRVLYYQPENLSAHFIDIFTPLLIGQAALAVAYVVALRKNGDRPRADLALALLWIGIALAPALLLGERPRRLAYLAVPGHALAVGAMLSYLHEKTRSLHWGTGAVALLLATTLHMRNGDWQRAGALERELPAETGCTTLVFDMPNLLGDALFFNRISTALWIRQRNPSLSPTLYSATDPDAPPSDPGCHYRYRGGRVIPTAPGPAVFVRGHNWASSPEAQ